MKKKKTKKNANKINHFFFNGFKLTTWGSDYCLRMLGYDAFEKFGLTKDETDALTKVGDWTCLVKKNGMRCAGDGFEQGTTDVEFVLKTASDCFPIWYLKRDKEDVAWFVSIFTRMIVSDADLVRKCFGNEYDGDVNDFMTWWLSGQLSRINDAKCKGMF